ncbi:MAG: hypothetical protein QM731_12430 [Chitinophagaceae bacterium]
MPAKDFSIDFDKLQQSALTLFNEDHNLIKPAVTEEAQLREIALLKETLGGERFFFVVNMLNFEMEHAHGVQKWLGYSEKEFTLKQYWDQVVHPGSKKSLLLVVQQMYQRLCAGMYPLEFMVQRFSTKIGVRHRNGHYLLAKKTSSIFQYDSRNRLLAYMDEFTIIGDYNGEPAEPRMYNTYGAREMEKEKEILLQSLEYFLEMKVFSVKELQIARMLAYKPGITQAQMAKEFDCSVHTIDTYYKRFLTKARDFFHKTEKELPSTIEAALFLKVEGLL